MWRASRFVRASILAEKFRHLSQAGHINFPTVIVDKTTQLYGSIETIQKKFRLRELVPSYVFDTTMEQINHVKDKFRLFSVHTPNEVSNSLQGMDQIFTRKANEKVLLTQRLIGLIVNTRDLKFPPAAGRFPDHMERITTNSIKTLQLLSDQGCSHYGHTYMIARMNAFNSKYHAIVCLGRWTCIALGIGKLIVDNDAEGYFLSPCPMFSDSIYFRASQPYHPNSGLLMRFVEDVFYICNVFKEVNLSGTFHSVPAGEGVGLPTPVPRPKVLLARRPVGARREEALRREEMRTKASFVLGGSARAGRPRTRPLPPAPRPPRLKKEHGIRVPRHHNVALFLTSFRGGRGRPKKRGASISPAAPAAPVAPKRVAKYPFFPAITEEFLKQDQAEGEVVKISDVSMLQASAEEESEKITLSSDMQNVEGLDELDELAEVDSDEVELDDLAELVDDLEDYERDERKKLINMMVSEHMAKKAAQIAMDSASQIQTSDLAHVGHAADVHEPTTRSTSKPPKVKTKGSNGPSSELETIPAPKPPQPGPDSVYSATESAIYSMHSAAVSSTEANEPPSTEETEEQIEDIPEIPKTLLEKRKQTHYKYAYTTPDPTKPATSSLKLAPEKLKTIRIAYYDAKSEKVLPHISQLISSNGISVETQEESLSHAIERAKEVWKTSPFAVKDASVAQEVTNFFGYHDIILTPTCPVFPPLATAGYPKKDSLLEWNALYYPFRLAGCPALHLPVIRSPVNGLPVSLQIVGRPLTDMLVVQVAHAIEQLFGPQYPIPMDLQQESDPSTGSAHPSSPPS